MGIGGGSHRWTATDHIERYRSPLEIFFVAAAVRELPFVDKVCDAVAVAGRNVMSTTSVVTIGLVSHRYGEDAAKVTHEGLDAAGYAIDIAWAVFKIRKAIPKSILKPTNLVRATDANEASSAKLKASSKSQ